MAKSEDFFLQTCNTLLERMINTVPSGVKLTDVIQPITIKPMMLQIEPNSTDGTLTVSGFVRVCMEPFTCNKHKGNLQEKEKKK